MDKERGTGVVMYGQGHRTGTGIGTRTCTGTGTGTCTGTGTGTESGIGSETQGQEQVQLQRQGETQEQGQGQRDRNRCIWSQIKDFQKVKLFPGFVLQHTVQHKVVKLATSHQECCQNVETFPRGKSYANMRGTFRCYQIKMNILGLTHLWEDGRVPYWTLSFY